MYEVYKYIYIGVRSGEVHSGTNTINTHHYPA